ATFGDLAPVKLYAVPELTVGAPTLLPDPALIENDSSRGFERGSKGSLLLADVPQDWAVDWSYERSWPSFRAGMGLNNKYRKKTSSALTFTSSLRTNDTWTLGAKNWRYSRSDGTNFTIGSEQSTGSVLGNAARLGGVALSRSA